MRELEGKHKKIKELENIKNRKTRKKKDRVRRKTSRETEGTFLDRYKKRDYGT